MSAVLLLKQQPQKQPQQHSHSLHFKSNAENAAPTSYENSGTDFGHDDAEEHVEDHVDIHIDYRYGVGIDDSRNNLTSISTVEEVLSYLVLDVRDSLMTFQSYHEPQPTYKSTQKETNRENAEKQERRKKQILEEGGDAIACGACSDANACGAACDLSKQQSLYYSRRGVAVAYSRMLDLLLPCVRYLHSTSVNTSSSSSSSSSSNSTSNNSTGGANNSDRVSVLSNKLDQLAVQLIDGALMLLVPQTTLITPSPLPTEYVNNCKTHAAISSTGTVSYDDLKAVSKLLAKKLLILNMMGDYSTALNTLQCMEQISEDEANGDQPSKHIEHMRKFLAERLLEQQQREK